jgi:hypothetical protein
MSDDEQFFAWLDGELGADEAARVHERVAADPHLSRLASEHRAMQAQLGQAFDSILDAPVPDRLNASVRPSGAEIIEFAAEKRSGVLARWPTTVQWSAMAATLALGVVAGTVVSQRRDSGPVQFDHGGLYAAGALGRALDTQLASAPSGDLRIGLTFRDKAGTICRSFSQPQGSGLACRAKDERWQLRGLFGAPDGQAAEYRMAAGMDPSLAALIDTTIAGEPLDGAQERAVKEARWR